MSYPGDKVVLRVHKLHMAFSSHIHDVIGLWKNQEIVDVSRIYCNAQLTLLFVYEVLFLQYVYNCDFACYDMAVSPSDAQLSE